MRSRRCGIGGGGGGGGGGGAPHTPGGSTTVLATLFHNTALLVKLLLAQAADGPGVTNVPIDDLFEEVQRKGLAPDEWPVYIHSRLQPA